VNDLLDISCIEAGKLALNLEELDPRAILDSTLPLVAVQAASQNLRLADETLEQHSSKPARWAFAFRDRRHGCRIPAERRNAMFDKFVRHDHKGLRVSSGAGPGLAIAKRLVEMMGGRIGLESGPDGKGSIAWFTLPLALATEEGTVEA
jgi:signal transduction histidine kinase